MTSLTDDLHQSFYNLRGSLYYNTFEGKYYPEKFENIYGLELMNLKEFLDKEKLDDLFSEKLFNFYIDYWHDYSTGDITDIVYHK